MPTGLRAGVQTAWTTFGRGPDPALAIHCALANAGAWAALARTLDRRLTITAFDMPGHGRSADWNGKDEIQELTAKIGFDLLDGPAHIIGHSFGATVALRMATMRPGLVRSLVLIEPVFFAVAIRDDSTMKAVHQTAMSGYAKAMAMGDTKEAARAFLDVWADGRGWDALQTVDQARIAAQMPLIDAEAPAIVDDVAGLLDRGVLDRVDMPVLLLRGSKSHKLIKAVNQGLADRLSRAQTKVIHGAGHMAPITHPDAVGQLILNFLSEV